MEQRIMEIGCAPECGFLVQSQDEKELVKISRMHAKSVHKIDVDDGYIKRVMRPV